MKFQISTPVSSSGSRLDLEEATEALLAQTMKVGEAYDAVLACEAQGSEIAQVLEDCTAAKDAIESFGVTVETMSIFNADGELSKALGLKEESLEALESLSVATKKCLKADYVAGLEGAIGDTWNKFVAFLKRMWEAVKRWFVELFDRNAKYARIVQENLDAFKKIGEKNEVEIYGLKAPQAADIMDAAEALLACVEENTNEVKNAKDPSRLLWQLPNKAALEKIGITFDGDGVIDTSKIGDKIQKSKGTLKDLGWTSDTKICNQFIGVAVGKAAKQSAKDVEAAYKKTIDEAASTKEGDDQKKELAKVRKNMLHHISSYMSAYNKLVGIVGQTLVSIVRKVK